ncbi:MAG: hypothetical protein AAGA83_07840 [Cyanobacteria bacterium P01_F01_bin.116]
MNASTQAVSIGAMSKISSISVLFRSEFPSAIVDLSPWTMDEQTQQQTDPNSLDFAFSFSRWHPLLNCGCVLLQICFTNPLSERNNSFCGIQASGYGHQGEYWQFSSMSNWQFQGKLLPSGTSQQQLIGICYKVHALFDCTASLPY